MCYAVMAHVTDYDVWHQSEASVSVDMVVKTLHQNTEMAQQSIQMLANIATVILIIHNVNNN